MTLLTITKKLALRIAAIGTAVVLVLGLTFGGGFKFGQKHPKSSTKPTAQIINKDGKENNKVDNNNPSPEKTNRPKPTESFSADSSHIVEESEGYVQLGDNEN